MISTNGDIPASDWVPWPPADAAEYLDGSAVTYHEDGAAPSDVALAERIADGLGAHEPVRKARGEWTDPLEKLRKSLASAPRHPQGAGATTPLAASISEALAEQLHPLTDALLALDARLQRLGG